MKRTLRKLVPAIAVGVVLACSYVAPAFGVTPVTSTVPVPCGRYGGGYSGDKHLVVCTNTGGNGAPEGQPGAGAAGNTDLSGSGLNAGTVSNHTASTAASATTAAVPSSTGTALRRSSTHAAALASPSGVVLSAVRLAE